MEETDGPLGDTPVITTHMPNNNNKAMTVHSVPGGEADMSPNLMTYAHPNLSD